MIFYNVWGYAHDPELWDNPEEFRPERYYCIFFTYLIFLLNTFRYLEAKNKDSQLYIFGAGARMCVGSSLAEEELYPL